MHSGHMPTNILDEQLALHKQLDFLHRQGLVSDLAFHFGRFIYRLDGGERPEVLLGACLASQWTGRGDVCLDLRRVAGRPVFEAADSPLAPPLDAWMTALRQSPVVGRPGDYRPLVLDEAGRLYLYRYWSYERQIATGLLARARAVPQDLDLQVLRDGLNRFFPSQADGETNWQKVAAAVALLRRLCVISGGPGTGKTTTIGKILRLLCEQSRGRKPLRIALAAPTGKAAARLEETLRAVKQAPGPAPAVREHLPDEASTIHRLLGARPDSIHYRHNQDNPLPVDVLVVDEASMVDLALMAKLLSALPPTARLILLGDKDQLASVESGAVLGDICGGPPNFSPSFRGQLADVTGERFEAGCQDAVPVPPEDCPLRDCIVQLQRNYRFGEESGIGRLGRAVRLGQDQEAVDLLRQGARDLVWCPKTPMGEAFAEAVRRGLRDYLGKISGGAGPPAVFESFHRFRVVCAHRIGPAGVETVNGLIIDILDRAGLLNARGVWYAGRPIMVTRNRESLRLYNGDIGITWPDPESHGELRVFFQSPEGTVRKFSPALLPEHETAFAMTVHKSQGSEFEEVLLLMPETVSPILTRELIYTAITRARHHLEIWCSEPVFRSAVGQRVERASGLRAMLWTPHP